MQSHKKNKRKINLLSCSIMGACFIMFASCGITPQWRKRINIASIDSLVTYAQLHNITDCGDQVVFSVPPSDSVQAKNWAAFFVNACIKNGVLNVHFQNNYQESRWRFWRNVEPGC